VAKKSFGHNYGASWDMYTQKEGQNGLKPRCKHYNGRGFCLFPLCGIVNVWVKQQRYLAT